MTEPSARDRTRLGCRSERDVGVPLYCWSRQICRLGSELHRLGMLLTSLLGLVALLAGILEAGHPLLNQVLRLLLRDGCDLRALGLLDHVLVAVDRGDVVLRF